MGDQGTHSILPHLDAEARKSVRGSPSYHPPPAIRQPPAAIVMKAHHTPASLLHTFQSERIKKARWTQALVDPSCIVCMMTVFSFLLSSLLPSSTECTTVHIWLAIDNNETFLSLPPKPIIDVSLLLPCENSVAILAPPLSQKSLLWAVCCPHGFP